MCSVKSFITSGSGTKAGMTKMQRHIAHAPDCLPQGHNTVTLQAVGFRRKSKMQDILSMLRTKTINIVYMSIGSLKHDKTNRQNEGHNHVNVFPPFLIDQIFHPI